MENIDITTVIDEEPPSAEEELRLRVEEQQRIRESIASGKIADATDVEPLELSTAVGHGPRGVQLASIGGKKIQVGPYTLSRQPLAAMLFRDMSISTLALCLAWAVRNGEGDMTSDEALSTYAKLLPPEQQGELDANTLMGALGGGAMSVTDEEVEALGGVIFLSAVRYSPSVTPESIKDELDYPEAVKLIGRILSLNTGLKHRFFQQSSNEDSS